MIPAGEAAMASVEEIERKQKAMQPLLEQIAQEKDADRIQQLGRQIAEMAQELARMADGLERAYAQATGGAGETRVVLTKDQRQRVAALDDSFSHPVIKDHLPVDDPILEMHVGRPPTECRGQFGQRQVVRRDQANRAGLDERANDGFSADAPIVRVGPVQDLVEQKQQRHRSARGFDDAPDAKDLRVEARLSGQQRVFHLDGRAQRDG